MFTLPLPTGQVRVEERWGLGNPTFVSCRAVTSILLEDISRRFGDVVALHPLHLDVPEGQFLAVLGPSGCGKTTLLRCLAGLERPDAGRVQFGTRTVFDHGSGAFVPPATRDIGMVFQDLALWPHMTVFENVAFTLRARRDTEALETRVRDALVMVGLPAHADRYPHQLSGGQQQRVALARAVVARPGLLLMDEPLSALDAALRIEIRSELSSLTRELGLTTIYVTHDQSEALAMADRLLVLDGGVVQQDAAPADAYREPATWFVANFLGRANRFDTLFGRAASPGGDPIAAVRPEHVRWCPGPDDLHIPATVTHASFSGERYELLCDTPVAHRPWIVNADYHHAPGTRIDLHVAIGDLLLADGAIPAEPTTSGAPAAGTRSAPRALASTIPE